MVAGPPAKMKLQGMQTGKEKNYEEEFEEPAVTCDDAEYRDEYAERERIGGGDKR